MVDATVATKTKSEPKSEEDGVLQNLEEGYLFTVSVKGRRSQTTRVNEFSLSMNAQFMDEETLKEFEAIRKEIQRLPQRFSPPIGSVGRDNAFYIGDKVWVSKDHLPDLISQLEAMKKQLCEEFPESVWSEKIEKAGPIRDLWEDRCHMSLSHDGHDVAQPKQIDLPSSLDEFKRWFGVEWTFTKLKESGGQLQQVVRSVRKQLQQVESSLKKKGDQLAKMQGKATEESKRIQQELDQLRTKRDRLDDYVNSQFQSDLADEKRKYFATVDIQISSQLQEFYLLVQKALTEFTSKGRVNGHRLSAVESKIAQIRETNGLTLNDDQVNSLCDSLEQLPKHIRTAQEELAKAKGEIPDLSLFNINFDGITNGFSEGRPSTPPLHLQLEDLGNIGEAWDEALAKGAMKVRENPPKKRSPKPKKTKPEPDPDSILSDELEEPDSQPARTKGIPQSVPNEQPLDLSGVTFGTS